MPQWEAGPFQETGGTVGTRTSQGELLLVKELQVAKLTSQETILTKT